MTFLAPALLVALPLALLPIIIHLIHLYRRRQVKWAAMMFLFMAQRMNRGFSRLRQVLILALRVLAVAAILFVITRPLAGGWLGLTGGAPDTVLILLDRSASMEQTNLNTGVSKRMAGLRNLSKAINDAVGSRSRLVLIDGALNQPLPLDKASALTDLPQTEATETETDIPALMQSALDYITTNKTGRTDVWLMSDLQRSDWDAASGRWATLRSAFATLQGVRFHILTYPQPAVEDLGVTVEKVTRRVTSEKAELLLDLHVTRQVEHPQPVEVPLRFIVNGASTTAKVTLKENQLALQAYSIPIDKSLTRGWGRVELPVDSFPANNVFYFVFDEAPVLRSFIVTDDQTEALPLKALLTAPADPTRQYAAAVLPTRRAAEIPWDDASLIVWQAPVPAETEAIARQMQGFVAAGRTLIFLPPENPDSNALFGLHWTTWSPAGQPQTVETWRNDADLLANTRDGASLPVGTLEITRHCNIAGEGIPLATLAGHEPLLMRATQAQGGRVYFLGTMTGPGGSSLARDGVVLFAALHRGLSEGAKTIGKAQQHYASVTALGPDVSQWHSAIMLSDRPVGASLALHSGVVASDDKLVALNRPPGEDVTETVSTNALNELFAGLDFRVLTDSLDAERSLTSEIWRTFLLAMAAALVLEALLCMPPQREIIRPVEPKPEREPQPV
ncbi:MAG TPA: BatA domain-containing protein [Chthoniobacteraceae bacterium]|jgi:hypothetical protein|nr:BatA domain-containing protein [Chthoniobacteraceae bacterium]